MTDDTNNPENQQAINDWDKHFSSMPLVAILRGIKPDEVVSVGQVLIESGFQIIEVPLNSPEPFDSIALLAETCAQNASIGAGTVLWAEQVHKTIRKGGNVIIAPNFDPDVAKAAIDRHAVYCPGVATPSEAFAAINAGATALKLFPGELITPTVTKALRAVLPTTIDLLPVGGISPSSIKSYMDAGANGFGIGSALYKPGRSLEELRKRAEQFVDAYRQAQA